MSSVRTYGQQICGAVKKNTNKIRAFQNISFHIMTNVPCFNYNNNLHSELHIKTINGKKPKCFTIDYFPHLPLTTTRS